MSKLQKRGKDVNKDDRNMLKGWSGEDFEQERIASGIPIKLETDSDCILRYISSEDISEKCDKNPGEAIVHKFFDGLKVVSVSNAYAMKKIEFRKDYFYYLWNAGEIETKQPQGMKDIVIMRLGVAGQEIKVPARVSDDMKLILNDDDIAVINYERLNYPLRDK